MDIDYIYNSLNRLIQTVEVRNGITTATDFVYDNNGNQKTVTETVYGGSTNVSSYEYDNFNQLKTAQTPDGKVITSKYDALGMRIEKSVNGITTTYHYDGTNVILEETGAIHSRNVYGLNLISRNEGTDPTIGRFITEDSYLGNNDDPLSLNLYTYCANNPIMYFDPSGQSGETAAVAATAWGLCLVDSPFLPFGDIAYGLTVAGTAVYEYGPAAYDWSVNVAAPWVSNAASDVGNWISKAADDTKEAGKKAVNWVKEQFGGGSSGGDPRLKEFMCLD